MELITPETMNIVWIVLGVAVAWIVLRFILKLASRIFAIGCFAIVLLGAALFLFRFINGG